MLNRMLKNDFLTAVGILVFLIIFLVKATSFKAEASLFPYLAGVIGIIACLVDMVNMLRDSEAKNLPKEIPQEKRKRFWIVFIGIVLFLLGIYYLGFMISAVLYMLITMWLLGLKQAWKVTLITVLSVGAVYMAFGYGLNVPIPTGVFGI